MPGSERLRGYGKLQSFLGQSVAAKPGGATAADVLWRRSLARCGNIDTTTFEHLKHLDIDNMHACGN